MLKAIGVGKSFASGGKTLEVLKGIDLEIPKASFTAIIGPSGAGKSTLLHILSGLDVPSKGRVIFEEQDLYALKDNALSQIRNKRIGFVFQFYHLLPEFNCLENVILPAKIGPKFEADASRTFAFELLEQMGLAERVKHFPTELSGGERQRVAIARSLINKPDLLFCDEPTGNLDSKSGEGIISLIKGINKERKTTIVLVTHNVELTKSADRVYHLKDGTLIH